MKFIYDFLIAMLPRAFGPVLECIQLELATFCVGTIDRARRIFAFGCVIALSVMLSLVGFLLAHIALFILLPWDTFVKALVFLGLGVLYFLVPLVFIMRACSRRVWLRAVHADEMVNRFSRKR